MKVLLTLWALLLTINQVQAAAVFAHFMVGNTAKYSRSDWSDDIRLAQDAHIDAFALNIAHGDPTNGIALPVAFEVASSLGFHLFFSFDYAGGGPWPKADVSNLITQYSSNRAYYRHNGKPFVSTFEGPGNAADWKTIKQETGCFFMPDWSSLGAKAALEVGAGIADGLFSWAAWPWGPNDMNTYVDASYLQFMNQTGTALPYMMPVSPWFYTNLPAYDKNWLWRGDDLWYTRWQQVLVVKPEFVEIITWNDYGESHYIGPLRDHAYDAFDKAPYNYVVGMPHDGWRLFLPFVIDIYKRGTATIKNEGLVAWYRLQYGTACSDGRTSGNTASQLQMEFEPYEIMQDKVFYSALLGSDAEVTVSIGGQIQQGKWDSTPDGGVGIYHGSVKFNGLTGAVIVTVSRKGHGIAQVSGKEITTKCGQTNGVENWNAWVGSAQSSDSISAKPKLNLHDQVCIKGTGVGNFQGLCEFGCLYGYCPIGACWCTALGAQHKEMPIKGIKGYPIAGESPSYSGLCDYACNHGWCPKNACGTVEVPLVVPKVSEFLPPTCVGGTGEGNLEGLCSFSCNYGYCPLSSCKCTAHGALVPAPPSTTLSIAPASGVDSFTYSGLCSFACGHGYCPTGACVASTPTPTFGTGRDNVYIDPAVWKDPNPAMTCFPPCTLIPAPLTLERPTTIKLPPWTTQITYSTATLLTTTLNNGEVTTYGSYAIVTVPTVIPIPPLTTTEIDVWAITITSGQTPTPIYMTSSVQPSTFVITITPTIGGTTSIKDGTTTVHSATTETFGSHTWTQTEFTETRGGFTTVISGTTLPPTATTITPHPYPTVTMTTPDPVLNTRITSFKAGPPGPLCTAGCGHACFLFCISACPMCPPAFGGLGDGSSTKTEGERTSLQTVSAGGYGIGFVEMFPTETVQYSDLRSVASSLAPRLSSLYASEQAHASNGIVTATITVKPTAIPASASTGIGIAKWTYCSTHWDRKDRGPCTFGWGIYTATSPSWSSFQACITEVIPFYTVTAIMSYDKPPAVPTPTLGPFKFDGRRNCFFSPDAGLSCVENAYCSPCEKGKECEMKWCSNNSPDEIYGPWEVESTCEW